MAKLVQKYNCENYDAKTRRDIVSVKYNMAVNGYYDSMASSYTFADDISPELLMIVSEKFQDNPGVRIGLSAKRQPVNSDLAPHIVGYSGKISEEQYERLKPHFNDMRELLSEISVQLSRTGQALQDADQQIASQIRG